MKMQKTELGKKIVDIQMLSGISTRPVYILNKTGEVTWSQIADEINLTSIRINFLSHELKVCFDSVMPTVKLETIFRECHDQEESCCGCRWFDKEANICVFSVSSLGDWPVIINECGYELEDKLW